MKTGPGRGSGGRTKGKGRPIRPPLPLTPAAPTQVRKMNERQVYGKIPPAGAQAPRRRQRLPVCGPHLERSRQPGAQPCAQVPRLEAPAGSAACKRSPRPKALSSPTVLAVSPAVAPGDPKWHISVPERGLSPQPAGLACQPRLELWPRHLLGTSGRCCAHRTPALDPAQRTASGRQHGLNGASL